MDKAKVSYSAPPPVTTTSARTTRKRPLSQQNEPRSSKRAKVNALDNQSEENAVGQVEEKNIHKGDDEDEDEERHPRFTQPILVSGATLKDYQLEGVAWMAGLYNNGISGILGSYLSQLYKMAILCSSWCSRRNGFRQSEFSSTSEILTESEHIHTNRLFRRLHFTHSCENAPPSLSS